MLDCVSILMDVIKQMLCLCSCLGRLVAPFRWNHFWELWHDSFGTVFYLFWVVSWGFSWPSNNLLVGRRYPPSCISCCCLAMLWFSESNDRSGLVRMTTARRSQKMVTWQFVGSEMDEFPHLFLYGCLCLCIISVKTAAMFDIKDRCQEIKFGMFFVVCVCVRVKKWQQTYGPMGTNEHNVMIKVSPGSFESRCCSIKKVSQKSTMFAFANWNRFFPIFSSHSSQCRYRYFFDPGRNLLNS